LFVLREGLYMLQRNLLCGSILSNSLEEFTPKETPQTLTLEAIFTIKGQKNATISGQNFVKGDFAFGKRVAQIFKNRVVLYDGGKEKNLILEGKKITICKHMQN
jgi:hypothetical protein